MKRQSLRSSAAQSWYANGSRRSTVRNSISMNSADSIPKLIITDPADATTTDSAVTGDVTTQYQAATPKKQTNQQGQFLVMKLLLAIALVIIPIVFSLSMILMDAVTIDTSIATISPTVWMLNSIAWASLAWLSEINKQILALGGAS